MKIKTSELTGPALDWAVAKCENKYTVSVDTDIDGTKRVNYGGMYSEWSTDWSQGGPILQNHISALLDCADSGWEACCCGVYEVGETALEAVCRAYVAAKLGEEVEVPDELC